MVMDVTSVVLSRAAGTFLTFRLCPLIVQWAPGWLMLAHVPPWAASLALVPPAPLADPEQTGQGAEKTLLPSDKVRGASRAWSDGLASLWVPLFPGCFGSCHLEGCHRPRKSRHPCVYRCWVTGQSSPWSLYFCI